MRIQSASWKPAWAEVWLCSEWLWTPRLTNSRSMCVTAFTYQQTRDIQRELKKENTHCCTPRELPWLVLLWGLFWNKWGAVTSVITVPSSANEALGWRWQMVKYLHPEHHHCLPTEGGKPLHWGHGSSLLGVREPGLIRKTSPVLPLGELSLWNQCHTF